MSETLTREQIVDLRDTASVQWLLVHRRALCDMALQVEHLERETALEKAKFHAAVTHLSHVYGFIHADDVVLPDGRRFKFHPPDDHVRLAWEGLSKAIRGIPSAIEAARQATSE